MFILLRDPSSFVPDCVEKGLSLGEGSNKIVDPRRNSDKASSIILVLINPHIVDGFDIITPLNLFRSIPSWHNIGVSDVVFVVLVIVSVRYTMVFIRL